MGFHISRIQIRNFRNFKELDVFLSEKSVIVGENSSGKSNFIHALRLVLDPELPDSARQLKEEDFWDGLKVPMEKGEGITVSVDFQGFENNPAILSILSDFQVPNDKNPTARITYRFSPEPALGKEGNEEERFSYGFRVYGGDDETQVFGYQQRRWIPLQVLPALRDAEGDLSSWRKSPLRPLLERLNVSKDQLESAAGKIDEATQEITNLDEVKKLAKEMEERLDQMVGEFYVISPTLGVTSTDALRLLRSLRLFVDGRKQRSIGDASLGICNVLYLMLLILELERKEAAGERASTILAIEEPEAHLHPHLQRLVYHDFLRRESPILLTTHSPNIVSVSPIRSLVLLRDLGEANGCRGTSTARGEFTETEAQDLERYLDATRGEILFAKGVILVEGYSELYTIPAFAALIKKPLDQRGISVCSVHGTDFLPYVRLLGKEALDIPFVIVTDGDPKEIDAKIIYLGNLRGIKIAEFLQKGKLENLQKAKAKGDWNELDKLLQAYGIFVGSSTLEIDLCNVGYETEFVNTLSELGGGKVILKKFEGALDKRGGGKDSNEADAYILSAIERLGKGRFAQRLAPKLNNKKIPNYVKNAITEMSKLVAGE
jgi:putative ATP-dependent endonuclease of OLD family